MQLRLALYSNQEFPANRAMDKRLLQLIGVAHPNIGYISAAPDPSRVYFESRRAFYAELGATLSPYVDWDTRDQSTLDMLFACDAIYLSGGNTFEFSRWLRRLGLLALLRRYAENGGVLVGVSAGSILMTNQIGTAALCGDIADHPVAEHETMALLNFGFWPHYAPGEEHRLPQTKGFDAAQPIYACEDGTGVIVDGDNIELYGPVKVIGGKRADE